MAMISKNNINDLNKAKGQIEKALKYLQRVQTAINFRDKATESRQATIHIDSYLTMGIDEIDELIEKSEFVFGANRGFPQNPHN